MLRLITGVDLHMHVLIKPYATCVSHVTDDSLSAHVVYPEGQLHTVLQRCLQGAPFLTVSVSKQTYSALLSSLLTALWLVSRQEAQLKPATPGSMTMLPDLQMHRTVNMPMCALTEMKKGGT